MSGYYGTAASRFPRRPFSTVRNVVEDILLTSISRLNLPGDLQIQVRLYA